MAKTKRDEREPQCSFCGRRQSEVKKLVAGPEVYICDGCIGIGKEILEDEFSIDRDYAVPTLKPQQIKEHLDKYVVGQEKPKKALAVVAYNHYKRLSNKSELEIQKSNVLLLGPTGSGKTYLVEILSRLLKVPFVIADATALTDL